MRRSRVKDQKGFTIIELLIATSVLAVLLLLASVIMANIGRLYQKGINQSRVQGATRTIANDVSEDLQLTGDLDSRGGPTPEVNIYCIGNTRYTYTIGRQLGTGTENNVGATPRTAHVLWRDKLPSGGCSTDDLYNPATGTEMVPAKSRLTVFDISATSPYRINVGVAYGDIDLLDVSQTTPVFSKNTHCLGSKSSQFCATAFLNTVATQRITESE